MKKIIVVGYGGHGKSIVDSIESMKCYEIVGYTDQKENVECSYPYLGDDSVLEPLFSQGIKYAALGIGYMGKGYLRDSLYTMLKKIGYQFPIIIDSSSIVSPHAKMEEGTFIGKGAIVNAYAKCGCNCIINSGAIVEHECEIGDFSHVAVGAVLCGNVKVGKHVLVGANSTIIQGIRIDDNSIIAAGTTVIHNLESNKIYYGLSGNKG